MSKTNLLIRCVSKLKKVKHLVPKIAFNEIRMKQIGFVISDPMADEKYLAYFRKPRPDKPTKVIKPAATNEQAPPDLASMLAGTTHPGAEKIPIPPEQS